MSFWPTSRANCGRLKIAFGLPVTVEVNCTNRSVGTYGEGVIEVVGVIVAVRVTVGESVTVEVGVTVEVSVTVGEGGKTS